MKKHNFYAGPSILSEYTKEETAKAVLDFAGSGLSIMEISHRSKEFEAVLNEAVALVKELLGVPEGYEVLFLQGGASMQFCQVPFNLMNKKAAYLNTGVWAGKALKEAKMFGEVVEVASSKDKNFNYIPKSFEVPSDVDYLHITTNNTIYGTQMASDPDVNVAMVADMSSDIFCRPIDFKKYNLVYAGAQKNLAPSGVTLVIVKTEALGKVDRVIPTMLDYRIHIENGSMFNTPPCIAIFAALQTLKWYKQQGGISAMQQKNIEKAKVLYDELDRNKLFKAVVPDPSDRSVMNICFVMSEGNEGLEKEFDIFANSKGLIGLKGHRSVGGFRASTYNALPLESVQALVDAMREFETKH
jgi:phosphoserine aminotransferase